MKTQLPFKNPWKSSHEPLGVRELQVENHCFAGTIRFHLPDFLQCFHSNLWQYGLPDMLQRYSSMSCQICYNVILL